MKVRFAHPHLKKNFVVPRSRFAVNVKWAMMLTFNSMKLLFNLDFEKEFSVKNLLHPVKVVGKTKLSFEYFKKDVKVKDDAKLQYFCQEAKVN